MKSVFRIFLPIAILCLSISSTQSQDLKWQPIAFGQSVDLNFSSTITPEKVGVNRVTAEAPGTLNGKITIESRGGKIAKAHDGITFYYTVLDPTKNNFVLEADILVDQFGPETNVAPNNQTACGIMVRDVNGAPRKDPMEFGYEELPASSNIAAVAVFSNEKVNVDATAVIRNGINFPWGNPDSSLTLDPFKKKIPIAKPFHLKLERTDSGFVMSYADLDGKNPVSKEYPGTADIVQVCEKNKMYLGFFAARNAKMTVSNAKLVLREAHTRPGTPYTLKPYDQFFEIESSDGSSSESYALVARSGYSGSLTVVQDEKTALAKAEIKAGEFYTFNTKLVNRMTSFELVFTPAEGPSSGPIKKNITVEKRDYGSGELIASPDGKADGNGTIQNPLDIATAIKFVNPGETIFLRGGNYGNIVIPRLYSGLDRKLKKLSRYKKEKPVVAGFQTFASYWHLYGIESAGSKTYGIWIEGSNNIIEQCVSHDSQNSGFQMDSPVHNVPLRSGNNLYQNCDSYDNVDPTMENADGYAAKTFTGTGNIYRGCISHNNADDGWDFFNNMQDGPIGAIVLENCIAYDNGVTTKGKTAGGAIGNGFKLGGEGQPVAHVIRNSIAFHNKMDGFTCNFNPGSITVEHCTAFDNSRCNYIFRSNPYIKPSGTFVNNISYRTDNGIKINDFIAGSANEYNLFWFGKNDKVKSADFVSLKVPSVYSRDERGGILLGDFLTLKSTSALAKGGKNKSFMGAIPPAKK